MESSSAHVLPIDRTAALAAASHYGDVIRLYRQARGFTQHELARQAGLNIRRVVCAERGGKRVGWHTVESIATALGVTPYELIVRE